MLKALFSALRNPDRDDEQQTVLFAVLAAIVPGAIVGLLRGGWAGVETAVVGAGLWLVANTLNLARSTKWLRHDLKQLATRVEQLERHVEDGRSQSEISPAK